MKKGEVIIVIIISLIFIFTLTLFLIKSRKQEGQTIEIIHKNQQCLVRTEEKIVRGNSLQGLIEDGQIIKALFGYYDCNKIERNDVVLYSVSGREAPLIKIIRGLPGDKFNLQIATAGGWHILINNEILKNSQDTPYLISEQGYRMLSLFINDFQGRIPAEAYLILSNLPQGGIDSTQFGLIHKKDILGRVEFD